jgi:hypothetical protein
MQQRAAPTLHGLSIFVLSKSACTEILKTNPMQHQGTRWHLLSKAVHAQILSKTGSKAVPSYSSFHIIGSPKRIMPTLNMQGQQRDTWGPDSISITRAALNVHKTRFSR